MVGTPFLFGDAEREALARLRQFAADRPVDMLKLTTEITTVSGKEKHRTQMTEQSIELPFGRLVTFSIEHGHPAGTCRHMSMSSPKAGRLPIPEAVWMVAEALGFVGGIRSCSVWKEELERGALGRQEAINVVQPMRFLEEPPGAQ